MTSAFPIVESLLLGAAATLYLQGWVRLRALFPELVSPGRAPAFLLGLLFAWGALGSPVVGLDHEMLSVHMIQHLLLMAAATPLILLGAPVPVLAHSLPESFFRTGAGRLFGRVSMNWLGRISSRTLFCWFAGTITVLGWHVPAAFEFAHYLPWWHEIEQATFMLAGLLFWWPVIRPWPNTAREPRWLVPLYLFLATLPCDALAAYLVFCDHVVYRPYLSAPRLLNLSALQDQRWAGVLMWVGVTLIYLVPAVGITIRLLSAGPRRTEAFDPTIDHAPEAS